MRPGPRVVAASQGSPQRPEVEPVATLGRAEVGKLRKDYAVPPSSDGRANLAADHDGWVQEKVELTALVRNEASGGLDRPVEPPGGRNHRSSGAPDMVPEALDRREQSEIGLHDAMESDEREPAVPDRLGPLTDGQQVRVVRGVGPAADAGVGENEGKVEILATLAAGRGAG